MSKTALFALCTLLALPTVFPTLAFGDEEEKVTKSAVVTEVHSGDVVTLRFDRFDHRRCRIHGIAAPHMKQPFGETSRQAVIDWLIGRKVTVTGITKNEVDPIRAAHIARIEYDGKNVSKELISQGFAWHLADDPQCEEYKEAEAEARENRRGLFAADKAVEPWVFRAQYIEAKLNRMFVRDEPIVQSIAVEPSKSRLFKTKAPVTRVSVVDPRVATVVQFDPYNLEIQAEGFGRTTVTIWFKHPGGEEDRLSVGVEVPTPEPKLPSTGDKEEAPSE